MKKKNAKHIRLLLPIIGKCSCAALTDTTFVCGGSRVCDTVDSTVTKQWIQQRVSLEGVHLGKARRVHGEAGLYAWDFYLHHKIDVIYQHLQVNCVDVFLFFFLR